MTTALPKGDFLVTAGFAAITGAGVALGFTVFDNASTWLLILLAVITLGAFPFLAGWLSSQRMNVLLFPISILGSLTVASAIDGPLSPDSDPIGFIIMAGVIYAVVASSTSAGNEQRSGKSDSAFPGSGYWGGVSTRTSVTAPWSHYIFTTPIVSYGMPDGGRR